MNRNVNRTLQRLEPNRHIIDAIHSAFMSKRTECIVDNGGVAQNILYLKSELVTSAKEVMFLPEFVCLSVCLQDNSKSYGRIFLEFFGNVGNGKNYQWFNFGGDPEGILDSGSLWNFRQHCFWLGIRETAAKPNMVLLPEEQHVWLLSSLKYFYAYWTDWFSEKNAVNTKCVSK